MGKDTGSLGKVKICSPFFASCVLFLYCRNLWLDNQNFVCVFFSCPLYWPLMFMSWLMDVLSAKREYNPLILGKFLCFYHWVSRLETFSGLTFWMWGVQLILPSLRSWPLHPSGKSTGVPMGMFLGVWKNGNMQSLKCWVFSRWKIGFLSSANLSKNKHFSGIFC